MNRAALCIKMLMKLKAEDHVSTKEMAAYLNTNPRNIREFRKELTEAGYEINEIRGRNGGYYLADKTCFPVQEIGNDKMKILESVRDFIKVHPEFRESKEAEEVLDMIICSSGPSPYKKTLSYISDHKNLSPKEEQYLQLLTEAIENRKRVKILYQGRDKEEHSYVEIEPLHIVCVEDSYYVIAWSRKAKDYRNYRISEYRMQNAEMLDKSYTVLESFNYEQYIGMNSAFKGKLTIYTVRVTDQCEKLFCEKNWGTELEKIRSADGWTTYKFTSDNPYHVFAKLFSLGDQVKLVKPTNLKAEFKEKVQSILTLYE